MKIRNLKLEGKIIMPPVATYQCDERGMVTDAVCEYYAKRAQNPRVALIITEHSYINLQGKARKKQMSIAEDDCIIGLQKLTTAIHQAGTKVFAQINHAGSAALKENNSEIVAPSAIILPRVPALPDKNIPRELTKEEIKIIIQDFTNAAIRAKKAGYDGVEIHSAHAYLLNQFYSPLSNKRTDEYGGCLENRLRIHKEVIRAVRQAVGEDYPIALRFGAADYIEGGNTIEDAIKAAKILEEEGIDLFDISGGMCSYIRNDNQEAGYFKYSSKAIKDNVSVPVNLSGGITTLVEAEILLKEGVSDFIGIGRELLKNPNWEM